MDLAARLIGTILRHDRKVNTYKLALIRAINDVVLSYPELESGEKGIVVPLKRLAEYWIAYYWPFVDAASPIAQGPRTVRNGVEANDIAFRPALTRLRAEWEAIYGVSRPTDGYTLISELRNARTANIYPDSLRTSFDEASRRITISLEQPIRYASGETDTHYGVFGRPRKASLFGGAAPLPGTRATDRSILVGQDVWQAFRNLSLWIEALCIHQWCLFTEKRDESVDRGEVYRLFTSLIEDRRPLTWERNEIHLLMLEGRDFACPWTKNVLKPEDYDLDHIVPISVYPTNELWNLVPADPAFNRNKKGARMPTQATMRSAEPVLAKTYSLYGTSTPLRQALDADLSVRFALGLSPTAESIARAVSRRTLAIADARSIARF